MKKIAFLLLVLAGSAGQLFAQTDDVYVEKKTLGKKAPRSVNYYSTAGFSPVFGLKLDALRALLQQANIEPFGGGSAPLQFQTFTQFRVNDFMLGGELSVLSIAGDMSPSTSSFTFSTTTMHVGRVYKWTKMDLVPYVGLGVQTAVMEIELTSPPLDFQSALTTPTATRFIHVDLIVQAGFQYQYYIGRMFYLGLNAGVSAPFFSTGWMYNATQLSDYPEFNSVRFVTGIGIGLRIP
jgi:hypothetical protein